MIQISRHHTREHVCQLTSSLLQKFPLATSFQSNPRLILQTSFASPYQSPLMTPSSVFLHASIPSHSSATGSNFSVPAGLSSNFATKPAPCARTWRLVIVEQKRSPDGGQSENGVPEAPPQRLVVTRSIVLLIVGDCC